MKSNHNILNPRPESEDDSSEEFEIDYLKIAPEKGPKRATYARIGGAALAVALTASVVASTTSSKARSVEAANMPVIKFETPSSIPPIITMDKIAPATNVTPIVDVAPMASATPEVAVGITPEPTAIPTSEPTAIPTPEPTTIPTPTPETPVTPKVTVDAAPVAPIIPEITAEVTQDLIAANLAELQAITEAEAIAPIEPAWSGEVLNSVNGKIAGPSGEETYYNLPMDNIVERMRRLGNTDEYWIREDGAKMLGPYVMVAANLKTHPRGSIVETSLGPGIVCDTGDFAKKHPNRLDLATNW